MRLKCGGPLIALAVWFAACVGVVAAEMNGDGKAAVFAEQFGGPEAVENRLSTDAERKISIFELDFLKPYFEFKKRVKAETGLSFGADYSTVA